jgi:hypothetical protein
MKTIVSFDIGIKNLAYCVFSVKEEQKPFSESGPKPFSESGQKPFSESGQKPFCASSRPIPVESTEPFTIRDWGIINLIEQDVVEKPKCNCRNAKGSVCGKSASYSFGEVERREAPKVRREAPQPEAPQPEAPRHEPKAEPKAPKVRHEPKAEPEALRQEPKVRHEVEHEPSAPNETLYCLVHAKSSGKLLPTKELSSAALKKLKVDELGELCIKHGIQVLTNDKKADILAKVIAHFAARTLTPLIATKSKNANQIHLVEIGKRIKTQFDHVFSKYYLTHVILENQISPIAGRMNTIQGMVSQYFIMRDRTDQLAIDFISSAGKLKGFVPDTLAKPSEGSTKDPTTSVVTNGPANTYKTHKRDGIAFCNQFMAANPGLATFRHVIDASTKKDDLADSFLQGIYFMRRENIINYSENLKINIV